MLIEINISTPEFSGLPVNWIPADGYDNLSYYDWSEVECRAIAPPPDLMVSQWADENRILQAGVSRKSGPWSTGFTPYLRDPMNAYNNDNIRHIVICFGTQIGKTESIYNMIGYIIDHEPYSTLVVYPRDDDCKGVSRTRIQPMIDDCACLREKKPINAAHYQLQEMHFPGMYLYLVGANSAAALAQKSCRNIIRDEIDKYPDRVGKDADPLSLSEARAKNYWDMRKIIDVSSPTVEGRGIWKQLKSCDVINELQYPCPHCTKYQKLIYKNIKYDDFPDHRDRAMIAKNSAYYVCIHCGVEIYDKHRPWMIQNGKYVADRVVDFEPEKVGFWASSLYSSMLGWGDPVQKMVEAIIVRDKTGDTGPLQDVINGWLAEPWKESIEQSTSAKILARAKGKRVLPRLIVPEEAVALTCGIDVQKVGFWFSIWAWNRNMESWLVHYDFMPDWDDIYKLCFETVFKVHNSDKYMGIWRAAMDIGGGEDSMWGDDWTKTEEIVTWIRENGRGVVHAVKGMSRNNTGQKVKHSIMDKMPGQKGGQIPGGLNLWLLDTNQFKDTFFWRLSNTDEDPQPLHLHEQTDEIFAKQIMAEEKQRNKNGRMVWVRTSKDNHLLDTAVYAHAAADFQWLGGVKILSAPQYREPVIHKAPRPAPVNRPPSARQSVKNFQRPSWLNRR